ncbi:MAG: aminotransferase class III-fold pyridoxal phosphate-dependent enzyme [Deltaproteobacteria bacterium]|nr:aminotransferase class III-fold pyridoxal phosphate-dependent enzyme [Deltaproteobacteria bacterium]
MNTDEIVQLCKQHTLYSWSAGGGVKPIPMAKAEGIYFWTTEGKRYIDFNSQLMSVNIGHGHPRVRDAIKAQADELMFAMPSAATAVRARLGKMLADLTPDPINTFFFTLGGAEANDNALRAAKLYTGRQKVLARYRSYHGASGATISLTGDPRRWPNEPGVGGVIHVLDPSPYEFSFGTTEEEITARSLSYLEEVIKSEGAHTIAAFFLETVTGTNGILVPPKGYLKGVRALCDKYGIVMICDEVMAGFGRTGSVYAFEHFGVVPDIVTAAKGLTSSYLPLGMMGISDAIAEHFQKNVFWGGLTYNAHPMLLACAEANIRVMLDEGMIENAAALEKVQRSEMDRLKAKHPSVKEGRCIGLFGIIELQKNAQGEPLAPFNSSSPAMDQLKVAFDERGLFTFVRWNAFMCNPPLCITEEQLREAYAIIDDCLDVADRHFEG